MAAVLIVICIVFLEVRDKPGQEGESEKGRGSFKGWGFLFVKTYL